MPVVTRASAVSLISFSLTSQANLFQLFQPMGGVSARSVAAANRGAEMKASAANMAAGEMLRRGSFTRPDGRRAARAVSRRQCVRCAQPALDRAVDVGRFFEPDFHMPALCGRAL